MNKKSSLDIKQLEDIATLKADISTLKSDVRDIKQTVTKLADDLPIHYVRTETFSDLQRKVEANTTWITKWGPWIIVVVYIVLEGTGFIK